MHDLRLLYDAWNVIAEFDASPTVPAAPSPRLAVSYAWGLDLSGTTTGAGGVGGLVSVTEYDAAGNAVRMLAPAYDTNGNVMAYADIATGVLTHRFEYDAFGIALTVSYSDNTEAPPFRFSTKYLDAETGLYYYGFRYYSPELGRWPSRDPIGEQGGINLYGMVGNDPVNRVDVLGLSKWNSAKGQEAIDLAKTVKAGGSVPSGHCCSSMITRCANGDCITFAAGVIRCGYLLSGDSATADKIGAISNANGTKLAALLEKDGWALVVYARDSRRVRATYSATNPVPPGSTFVTGEAIAGTFATAVNTGQLYGMTVAGAIYDLAPTPIPGETRTAVSVPSIPFAFLSGTNDYHTGVLAGTTAYHSPGLKELSGGLTAWSGLYQATQIGYMMLAPDSQGSLPTFKSLLDAKKNHKAPRIIPP